MKYKLLNGNNKHYTIDQFDLEIKQDYINPVALEHIKKYTGLEFVKQNYSYKCISKITSHKFTKLVIRYNYSTRYFNNASIKNTMFLYPANFEN